MEKAPRVLSKEEALALRRAADPNYKARATDKPAKRKKGLGFDEAKAGKRQKGDVPDSEGAAEPSGPRFESAGEQVSASRSAFLSEKILICNAWLL